MDIVLYTRDNCSYCQNAKVFLMSQGIAYKEFKLGHDFTREYIKEAYPNASTYPVVIVDGFYIGGFNQLQSMLAEEKNNNQKLLNEEV